MYWAAIGQQCYDWCLFNELDKFNPVQWDNSNDPYLPTSFFYTTVDEDEFEIITTLLT